MGLGLGLGLGLGPEVGLPQVGVRAVAPDADREPAVRARRRRGRKGLAEPQERDAGERVEAEHETAYGRAPWLGLGLG